MGSFNSDEFERRNKELADFVDGKGYVYVEYCECCRMPYVLSKGLGGNSKRCGDCRKLTAKERKLRGGQ